MGRYLARWAAGAAVAGALAVTPAGAAKEIPPLKITKPEAAKGLNQVVIGAFNVGFLFESTDTTKAAGGMLGMFQGATNAKSQLVGVTPEVMQAVTDAAYDDFKAQLAAKGYAVADPAALFGSDPFKRVKPAASPFEASVLLEKGSKGKTDYYKPTALPGLVMMPGDFTASGLSGMGMNMAAGQAAYAIGEYAKASGQAVVDVVYLIDFSNVQRPGAFSFSGVKVNSGMSVTSGFSRASVVAPSGKIATVAINQPVAVEGDFATVGDTTGGFNKAAETTVAAAQVAGNVLGALAGAGGLGGIATGHSRKYTFTAKPDAYREGATKAATLANARVVEQLAALR